MFGRVESASARLCGRVTCTGVLAVLLVTGSLVALPSLAVAQARHWVASWAASPQQAGPGLQGPGPDLSGRTLRQRVHLSAGGGWLRLRLSNELGTAPLRIGAVTVALPDGVAGIRAGSLRQVTFAGQRSALIPPGAPLLSDPVEFAAKPGTDVTISIYCPADAKSATLHADGLATSVISPPGDFTASTALKPESTTTLRMLVSAVLVQAPVRAIGIVAFGDSITDGTRSTVDANRRWPDVLAHRFAERGWTAGIANAGIAGNRLLRDGAGASALARLDRDVLALPGVTHVIVLEGINDIGWPGAKWGEHYLEDPKNAPTAEDLIAAYRQIIDRIHAHGVKVIGATLTPFEGTDLPGYYTPAKESVREAVNHWIRSSGAFDGIIDFDAAIRDPAHPSGAVPKYISSDHIHPTDAGYEAMGQAVPLDLFH